MLIPNMLIPNMLIPRRARAAREAADRALDIPLREPLLGAAGRQPLQPHPPLCRLCQVRGDARRGRGMHVGGGGTGVG